MINIKIKNFKSINNINFSEENKNVISIMGPNDSGKSNIIDAINSMKSGNTFESTDFLSKIDENVKDEIELSYKLGFKNTSLKEEIHKFLEKYSTKLSDYKFDSLLEFLNNIKEKDFSIEYDHKVNVNPKTKEPIVSNVVKNQELKTLSQEFWKLIYKPWSQDTSLARIWTFNNDSEQSLRAYNFPMNYFKRNAKMHRDFDFIESLIDLYRSFSNLELPEPKIIKLSNSYTYIKKSAYKLNLLDETNTDLENSKNAAKLRKWFDLLGINAGDITRLLSESNVTNIKKIIDVAKEKVDKRVAYIKPKLKKPGFNLKIQFLPNNTFTIFLKSAGEKGYVFLDEMSSISDGNKKLLTLFLELLSIDKRMPTIVLIDEPEIHLNPKYQEHFLDFLEKMSQQTNIFIIYTTHSPFMICQNGKIAKKVVFRHKNNNQSVMVDYYSKVNNDIIDDIDINILDLTLSEWTELKEYSKLHIKYEKIILVEGKNDKMVIDKALKHWDIKNIVVLCLVGWNATHSGKNILEKLSAFEGKIKIILDYDYGGKEIYKYFSRCEGLKNNIKYLSDFDSEYLDKGQDYTIENFINFKGKLSEKSILKTDFSSNKWENFKEFINKI